MSDRTEQQSPDTYSSASRPTSADIQRLYSAVFGDGFSWDGILEQLRSIKREVTSLNDDVGELSESVHELVREVATLRNEVNGIKDRIGDRGEENRQTTMLLWVVTAGLGILIVIALWPLVIAPFT